MQIGVTMSGRKESFSHGAFYTLISGTTLSILGLLAKIGSERIPISGLIFWRFVFALSVGAIACYVTGLGRAIFFIHSFWNQLLRTCFVLMAQYAYFYYVSYNSLLNATVLLSTGPIFIPLIERVVLRKYVGKSTWISILVSFVGVILVIQPDAGIFSWMSGIGLLAGIFQGASQTVLGVTAKERNPFLGVVHLMLLCTVGSFVPYLVFDFAWVPLHVQKAPLLLLAMGVLSLLNQLTRATAYAHGTPSRLSVFLYISVLFAALFDWIIYGQSPGWLSSFGALLVVLGGTLKVFLRIHYLKKRR